MKAQQIEVQGNFFVLMIKYAVSGRNMKTTLSNHFEKEVLWN
jgi:hypothetical protein